MRDLFDDINSGVMDVVIYVFVTSRRKKNLYHIFLSHYCNYQLISRLVIRHRQENIKGKHFLVNV